MSDVGRRTVTLAPLILLALLVVGCRTAPNTEELTPEQQQILQLQAELESTEGELTRQLAERDQLEQTVQSLESRVAGLQAELLSVSSAAEQSAESRDTEIEALRAEREALLRDMERLSNAAEVAAAEAANARAALAEARARSATETEGSGSGEAASQAIADAVGGLGGFRRVESLGFTPDTRLASRLGVAGSGLAVDSSGDKPVLFDPDLSFDTSLIYLTIVDPSGTQPRLVLTVQYVSDVRPLYAQTAFIAIEGTDPIDPVDPVIFTGGPARDTDGERIREAFSRDVDRALLNRIASMLTSGRFSSTFVGSVGRESHRPTVTERSALSRVLFAFIDLGGFR